MVEAGLGGRHDATGVLRAPVVVLTNVGLEHTRWLGPTVADIAGEKLAVVAPDASLVLGDVDPEVEALAARDGRAHRAAGAGRDRRCPATSARTSRWPARPRASGSGRSTPRRSPPSRPASPCPGGCRWWGSAR